MINIDEYYDRKKQDIDNKRAENLRVIAEYRKRRELRLDSRVREDANIRNLYGIAKSMGIDTTGMKPKELIEALKGKGVKTYGKGSEKAVKASNKKESGETTYKKSYTTPSGKKFPQIKEGAFWDADTLSEVNRLAKGRTKQMDAVIDSVKPNDIVYQKDLDGKEVASIPGLSQKFNSKLQMTKKDKQGKSYIEKKSKECIDIYNSKINHGKEITSDLMNIAKENGTMLVGLENCYKGGSSTAQKIDRKKNAAKLKGENPTDEDTAKSLDDVVRYTMKVDQKNAAKSALKIEEDLKKKGYEIVQRDNKYFKEVKVPDEEGNMVKTGKYEYDKDAQYKGIHITAASPSGELVEVQVHSSDTLKLKNKNHKLYEEQRKIDPKSEQAKELGKRMSENAKSVEAPDGIEDYVSFDNRKEWKAKHGYKF